MNDLTLEELRQFWIMQYGAKESEEECSCASEAYILGFLPDDEQLTLDFGKEL